MKIIKRILFFFILFIYLFFLFFPTGIGSYNNYDNLKKKFNSIKKGQTITLNSLFDNKQVKSIYLINGGSIFDFPRILKTSNRKVIDDFINASFFVGGGDMATIEEQVIIMSNNNELLFKGAMSYPDGSGIQTRLAGYLESKDPEHIQGLMAEFKKYYFPFVIHN